MNANGQSLTYGNCDQRNTRQPGIQTYPMHAESLEPLTQSKMDSQFSDEDGYPS